MAVCTFITDVCVGVLHTCIRVHLEHVVRVLINFQLPT
jgi:hypothetical protein